MLRGEDPCGILDFFTFTTVLSWEFQGFGMYASPHSYNFITFSFDSPLQIVHPAGRTRSIAHVATEAFRENASGKRGYRIGDFRPISLT